MDSAEPASRALQQLELGLLEFGAPVGAVVAAGSRDVHERVDVVDRALGLDGAGIGIDLDLVRLDVPIPLVRFPTFPLATAVPSGAYLMSSALTSIPASAGFLLLLAGALCLSCTLGAVVLAAGCCALGACATCARVMVERHCGGSAARTTALPSAEDAIQSVNRHKRSMKGGV